MKKIFALLISVCLVLLLVIFFPRNNYTNNGEMIIGTYNIDEGKYKKLSKTKFTEDNEYKLELISSYVENMLPEDNFNMLDSLVIISDGEGETLAYVYQKDEEWVLSIDYLDALNKDNSLDNEFVATLSHELMHLITLNSNQMDSNSNLSTYETTEGKLKKDSYLNKFYELYWQDEIKYMDESMSDAERIIYFEEHMDMYINDYATTNPEEDIAESFAAFVIYDKPIGNEIFKEKILFFYNYPELVSIREEIRKNSGL